MSVTGTPPRRTVAGLGIRAIATAIPETAQTVSEAAGTLGLSAMQVKMFGRLFGLDTLPYDPSGTLAALLGDALDTLRAKAGEDVLRARYLVHCHTIPAIRPPRAGLGLEIGAGCEAFGMTMAHCASSLLAFELLDWVLGPDDTAIVLVGEKAFHPRVRVIEDTTIMSDGAVALLVGRGGGRWQVGGTHVTHAGAYALSRGHPREEPPLPEDYVGFVAGHIRDALARFGRRADELALILPHNVNLVSWSAIARKLGLPMGAIYTSNIPRIGHCFGADPFFNLHDADDEGRLSPGDTLLCVSVGMGMSAASSLIEIPPLYATPSSD